MTTQQIQAPFPGVFYRTPSPDEPVYVEEGQAVQAGDVIGLIEVMKQFVELKAEASGTLVSFSADNESVLEAGDVIGTLEVNE
ncbi:biotin carboxyl carrier domain-containing protein [Halomonas sp. ML-15]|uniref:Biotin carboxyl carrier protein of acetyl-CoA carboxylase n=1 Tax=Halomonas salipaludis TaxID=2032625 RepID=A0A2A2EQP6_9GAMM|nr:MULTISPECIES: acetyl-CoA carboxylase [Halomonas]MBD3895950.1 biotin carboxyl carrier domain-containing protein [Halomonas sp. ML-15]PAU74880.1 acetyl-CoA carboxylase biotin carboxyl carrier protein subunit [Halomonas salipaludis]